MRQGEREKANDRDENFWAEAHRRLEIRDGVLS